MTSLSSSSGPLAGGTSVTIQGMGFDPVAANNTVRLRLDLGHAEFGERHLADGEQPGRVGAGGRNRDGGRSDLRDLAADHFTYVAAPVVTSLSPSSGPLATPR